MTLFGLAPPSACHAFTGLDQILRNPRWSGMGLGHRQSAKEEPPRNIAESRIIGRIGKIYAA
jgi:hypothetical protein